MFSEKLKKILDRFKFLEIKGDRSERIRTYNFPQGRVTDHRINLTLHKLEEILDGSLDEIIKALTSAERLEAMIAYENSSD